MLQHRVTGQRVSFSVTQPSTIAQCHLASPELRTEQSWLQCTLSQFNPITPLSPSPGRYVGGGGATRGRNSLLLFSSGLNCLGFISLLQKSNLRSLMHTKWLLCASLDSSSFLFIDACCCSISMGPTRLAVGPTCQRILGSALCICNPCILHFGSANATRKILSCETERNE